MGDEQHSMAGSCPPTNERLAACKNTRKATSYKQDGKSFKHTGPTRIHLQNRSADIEGHDLSATDSQPIRRKSKVRKLNTAKPLSIQERVPITSFYPPLPKPGAAPPDQNLDELWHVVHNMKEIPSFVPTSTRGSVTYGELLYQLGIDLNTQPSLPRTADPSNYEYLQSYNQDHSKLNRINFVGEIAESDRIADELHGVYTDNSPNESSLQSLITQFLFPLRVGLHKTYNFRRASENIMMLMVSEAPSSFTDYNLAELVQGVTIFPFIRMTCKEIWTRDRPKSAKTTAFYDSSFIPSSSDLRTRADIAIGIRDDALPPALRIISTIIPGYDAKRRICAQWLHIEFKKDNTSDLMKTAVHQWAIEAYVILLGRVRINREGGYNDSSVLTNVRHYGYIIGGLTLELWEMSVETNRKPSSKEKTLRRGKGRSSIFLDNYFTFPATRLSCFDLRISEDVSRFLRWHMAISDWGVNCYARNFVTDLMNLGHNDTPVDEYLLSYEDAVGGTIHTF